MATDLLRGPTRCLILRPAFLENTFYNLSEVFRTLGANLPAPPLGALVVAAHLPSQWRVRFVDEGVEPLTDEHFEWADIIMISGIGPQQETILRAARRARALGKPVVVGGAGPTLQPDVYAREVDFVVVGEAETALPKLLEDLGKGVRSGVYRSEGPADPAVAPIPRYDLAKLDRYLFVGLGYTRGCPFKCEFCAQIAIFGQKSRTKSARQIIDELQTLYDLGYRGMVDFGYDNLIGDVRHTEGVLRAMADWSKEHDHPFCYSTEATMNLARLPHIMELMRANDFRYVFIGIESGEADVLDRAHKGQNTSMPPEEAIRIINSYGMVVNTGVILGFDGESPQAADHVLEMVQKSGAFPSLVLPLHALPGTELARRLAREGRLFAGSIENFGEDRTDTATTGLNFVTARPRTQILADLARVLETLYTPEHHYARADLIRRQLRASPKFRPSAAKLLSLSRSFLKIASTIGVDRRTGPRFWKALAMTLLTNPKAVEAVIGQAVFNWNYAKQARSYIESVRKEIAEVQHVGEVSFNEARLAASELVQLRSQGAIATA